jgi:hypothetical protein
MRRHITPLLIVVAIAGATLVSQTSDLRTGTWKLNVGKSTFSPGPAPKSQTLTWQLSDDGFKFTVDGVNANGQKTHSETVAKADGKDYPVTGAENPTTRAYRRINDRTWEVIEKVDGKFAISRKELISADGKILTVISAGTNAQGQKINHEAVYNKQ